MDNLKAVQGALIQNPNSDTYSHYLGFFNEKLKRVSQIWTVKGKSQLDYKILTERAQGLGSFDLLSVLQNIRPVGDEEME